MRDIYLHRAASGERLAGPLKRARTAWERMVGLLGTDALAPGRGMVIEECWAVHTFFMKYPIDIVFADRALRVTALRRALPPWRMAASLRAASVIELGAGTLEGLDLAVGETLEFRPQPAEIEPSP